MATEKKEKMEGDANPFQNPHLDFYLTSKTHVAQIKSADMGEDMQQEAIDVANDAIMKHTIEKDIAQYIKKTFDERKGATWHCIVGRNFGSFVTHETKHFIYFYLGHFAILLFKTQ